MELIQPELIQQTGPTNIQQSVNRLNGVQVIDNQANIRSGSGWSYGAGSRVQVLVNGLPMLSGDAAQPQWSFIPSEGVENIEVIKGAASVVYGSSALNGVININTITHSSKPQTRLFLSSGIHDRPQRSSLNYQPNQTANLHNFSAFHVGKIKGMDFTIGLNGLVDDGYKMSDGERRGRTTIGIRKPLRGKNAVWGLNTGFQMGKSFNFLLWDSYHNGYNTLDNIDNQSNTLRINIDPYYVKSGRDWTQKVNGRYLKVSNEVDNGDTAVDQSNFSDVVYVEYQAKTRWKRIGSKLVMGGVGQYSETRSPLFSGNQTTSNLAAYVQLEKQWSKLLISTGVRYEQYQLNERTEGRPVLRAGLNYEAAKATFIRLSYGQGYRFPSVAETFIATSVGPVTIFPNPDLKSEMGYNLELGLKQGFKLGKVQGVMDLALYRMEFDQMTEFTFAQWADPLTSSNFGIGFKSVNAGKTRISGFEWSTVFKAEWENAKLQGFAGYNFTHAVSLSPDQVMVQDFNLTPLTYRSTSTFSEQDFLKYRPRHTAKADVIFSYKRWDFGYGIAAQSRIETIDTAFVSGFIALFVPGVDSARDLNLTQYVIHNLRVGYTVIDGMKISLITDNLFNREYMIRPADLAGTRRVRLQISYTL